MIIKTNKGIYSLSSHATERMKERNITQRQITEAIESKNKVKSRVDYDGQVKHSYVSNEGVRVVVKNKTNNEKLVVTVIKESKSAKVNFHRNKLNRHNEKFKNRINRKKLKRLKDEFEEELQI